MSKDEAEELWLEIDFYRYGHVSANLIQRWLEDAAHFSIPPQDTHFLYDLFLASEQDMRISKDQFMTALVGSSADEASNEVQPDQPSEEEESLRIKKDGKEEGENQEKKEA